MKTLSYKADRKEIKKELEGLAYWIADTSYIKERYGSNDPELKRNRDTVNFIFDNLDRLHVPNWVVNSVIAFSEDWRRYKTEYLENWLLKNLNIDLSVN